MIIYLPNPKVVPSLREIGDLSCITFCLIVLDFLMDPDTLLKCSHGLISVNLAYTKIQFSLRRGLTPVIMSPSSVLNQFSFSSLLGVGQDETLRI